MYRILIIIAFFNTQFVFSQSEVYDTAKRIDPFKSDQYNFYSNHTFNQGYDSSMNYIHQYDKIKRQNTAIQSLGDISMPYLNLGFKPEIRHGFIAGFQPFGDIYLRNDSAKFYNSKLPFTEFHYTQGNASAGRNGMINFDAMHTQNFGERANVSALYHSASNVGFYKRQKYAMKNLQLSSYIKSKNNRYIATLLYSWNKSIANNNGGILPTLESDSNFRAIPSNFRQVEVSLDNSDNINKYREYQISQQYWLIRKSNAQDTTIQNILAIKHQFNVLKQINEYTDNSTSQDFYNNVFYGDSKITNDSMFCRVISNDFQILTPQIFNQSFMAGVTFDNIEYFQQINPDNYHQLSTHNLSIHSKYQFIFLKRFQSDLSGRLYLSGFNSGDYSANWVNNFKLNNRISLKSQLLTTSRRPSYQQLFMLSNNYFWNNSLNNSQQQHLSLGIYQNVKNKTNNNAFAYTRSKISGYITANYTLINGYIYFDEKGLPKQGSVGQNIAQIEFMKNFDFRKFQIRQQLIYQVFSNEIKNTLLLPDILSKTSIYFQNYAFKKSTFIKIGLDINYVNSYRANTFNPALQSFMQSSFKVGGYPFVDFFINAEIKTARVFFIMEHANQLVETFQQDGNLKYQYLFPNYMYTSPFHPSAPRRFRLGFAWKFYY
ncbi:MAG: putative porin [Bacteroidota bacterium]|nr:putative porin [Bacteroidota bacterium]